MATIQNVRTTDNPQRSFEWEVEILGNTTTGSLPLLSERSQNVTLPTKSVETIEINYKGRKTIHAGRDASPHTISVTFWDDESHSVYNFFNNWMENGISNSEIGGGLTRDLYAVEMVVKKFAHDSNTVTGINRYTKVFPTEIGDISLSYDASEHMSFDVTFSYDSDLFANQQQ